MYIFLNIILFLTPSSASRILGILPHKSYSHQQIGTKLLFALAERGHNVTIVTGRVPNKINKNVTIIEVDLNKFAIDELVDLLHKNHNFLGGLLKGSEMLLKWSEALLNDTNMQRLINSKTTFDVVIIDLMENYAHKAWAQS